MSKNDLVAKLLHEDPSLAAEVLRIAAERKAAPKGMDISAVRKAAELSQSDLAERLGVQQTTVSRMERQDDWKLSTVAAYMAATGASATITVEVGGETLTYALSANPARFLLD